MLWNMLGKDTSKYSLNFRDKISGEDFILTFFNIENERKDKSRCKRNYKYHEDSLIGMLQNPETARKVLATFLIRKDGEEWFKFW